MKTISTGLLMAILSVSVPAAYGQDELKKLDEKLTEAFKKGDFKLLAKHMADDYLLIDPRGGTHTKTQYLKHLENGTAKFEELKETNVKVIINGDTGVVTGLLHAKGKFEEKTVNAEYRWTRVYHKVGEEWKVILEQHTHVHKEAKKKAE